LIFSAVLNSALQKALPDNDKALAPADGDYVVELTKALFNITLDTAQEDTQELLAVANTLDRLLNTSTQSTEQTMSVRGSIINVVTNFEGKPEVTAQLFGANLGNVRKLLDFLIYKIEHISKNTSLKVTSLHSIMYRNFEFFFYSG
jgi:hypothetical protein